ncbi:cytochrome c biogenesis CcdA family protein [Ammoniphilus sp. CFH 90114]|uniref:cytochrome c biogenesis CcdA family protein n=1 Tax=Ammoniphilus sp. CFH 90114 TaxID=2493665 RepID=UPI00100EDBDF|nr:cytochrome c biogenesis protein CcdA [Ammoniphilus sp. CFH 90114]RXT13757.1 cytochrome c biogenesis protein CcdA [Ammoniphilus sp. CFH 90114]
MNMMLAFGAGILSFVSPCILPLIPSYLAMITGISASDWQKGKPQGRENLLRIAVFVGGLILPLVLLGMSASTVGQWLSTYQKLLTQLLGLIVVIFGFHLLGWLRITWFNREYRLNSLFNGKRSTWSIGLMGVAFGLGWTPCIGPMLSSILVLASQTQTMWEGGLLLLAYGLGLGLPFLFIGLLSQMAMEWLSRLKKYMQWLSWGSGLLLVIIGCLLIFGKFHYLSFM